jgi:hypothetical protein
MLLSIWMQLNNSSRPERATFAAFFDEKLHPSEVVLFCFAKYYGFLSIAWKRFTSRLVTYPNVHWNNNIFNLA